MIRNKGNRPLAVTAIALLSLAIGVLTLLMNMVVQGYSGFYLALRLGSISRVWDVAFGILTITVSVAMFSGFKWVWYASMAMWAAEIISWVAELVSLSYSMSFSLFILLNMLYFFRHDIQEYFSVKAFWTWE